MRIALFITCFNDMMFPHTGRAVTELLERLGHTVEFPQGQTCCGQMHFNTGYRPETLPLVRRFAEVFAGYDAVVTPSGSCAGMVRDHHRVVAAQLGDLTCTFTSQRRGDYASHDSPVANPGRSPSTWHLPSR